MYNQVYWSPPITSQEAALAHNSSINFPSAAPAAHDLATICEHAARDLATAARVLATAACHLTTAARPSPAYWAVSAASHSRGGLPALAVEVAAPRECSRQAKTTLLMACWAQLPDCMLLPLHAAAETLQR